MIIQENVTLAEYTTFKIGGPARFFCSVTTEEELHAAAVFAQEKKIPVFVLGGGSNILVNDRGFDGMVIRVELKGITYKPVQGTSEVLVSVSAGELWDSFVQEMVSRGLFGIENLSAIPGTVGAAPVQNIGAYGTEVCETIEGVKFFDLQSMVFKYFSNKECEFAYRTSLFKKFKNHYVITSVDFKLDKEGKVNTTYRDVRDYFAKKEIEHPTLEEVRNAVIDIRWNKLPDWKLWGTAGSFFKNPIISVQKYAELKSTYPELPGYPENDGSVKIPLGWILDKVCNVKGLCIGNVCVYEKQSLVLVSKPGASSEEVVSIAQELMKRVKETTGIEIEGEVEWVN
ncbi:MAG: UDP-N-acetylmuramate dehydrogenase [bacterium]|nr:UDP-N-acetylmuramate dehydrogenase [bacterium]